MSNTILKWQIIEGGNNHLTRWSMALRYINRGQQVGGTWRTGGAQKTLFLSLFRWSGNYRWGVFQCQVTSSAIRNEISTNQSLEETTGRIQSRDKRKQPQGETDKTKPRLLVEVRSAVNAWCFPSKIPKTLRLDKTKAKMEIQLYVAYKK